MGCGGTRCSQSKRLLQHQLDAEVRAEQEKDRIYWAPLKREMEEFRRAERESS